MKKRKVDQGDSDGEAGDGAEAAEKKKRAKYTRAPLGSLANPNWDGMLG